MKRLRSGLLWSANENAAWVAVLTYASRADYNEAEDDITVPEQLGSCGSLSPGSTSRRKPAAVLKIPCLHTSLSPGFQISNHNHSACTDRLE